MYIPICFAYIIPVSRYRWFNNAISTEQIALSRRPFIVMGALDSLATSMQVFSSVYLPGPLLVLLPQAAIPCSMILSKRFCRNVRYHWMQYLGAVVVLFGILVVLEPVVTHRRAPDYYCEAIDRDSDCTLCQPEATQEACLSHSPTDTSPVLAGQYRNANDDTTPVDALCQWLPYNEAVKEEEGLTFIWSLVMLASVIPMTLSTIYKEIALGGSIEIDPVYLNGWIAIFQFLFSMVLAVPAGILASPSVKPSDLPQNIWDGTLCFVGQGMLYSS